MTAIEGATRIVDEDFETSTLVRPVPVLARTVMKPIAMKVVRPIPRRISEQFYNEAFQEGLTMKETSEAAVLAHDWHRKWTQQDEENHTTPDADFYAKTSSDHYGFDVDRQGAANPYLGESDQSTRLSDDDRVKRSLNESLVSPAPSSDDLNGMIFRREDRLSASSFSEASNSSSLSSHMAPHVKRRFVGVVLEDAQPVLQAPVAVRPMAVRPTAVRAVRPEIFRAHEIPLDGVPQDVMAGMTSISPMSCVASSMGSQSLMQTVTDNQNEVVHVVEDDYEPSCEVVTSKPQSTLPTSAALARDAVLHSLAVTRGDVDSDKFKNSVDPLLKYFSEKELDTRPHLLDESDSVDGMWLSLSKPSFFGCLGSNDSGDPMYTLGRMAFDMFSPTNLVCSLQGNFNPVEVVTESERKAMLDCVPKGLRQEVQSGKTVLRTYHIVAAFTIEPDQASFPNAPNRDVHRPIKGIMTTYGYSLPDPEIPNRHSIWFTGGRIEPNNHPTDIFEWKRLFTLHPPKHTWGEKAKLLAVKLLMGATVPDQMNDDGSMVYAFTRPIGGHGMAYVDVVYLDETMRIVRGHRGTIFVFSRLPQQQ